jgi:hypothetical protein
MENYDDPPSATADGAGYSSWFLARAGNAIDVLVDRAIRQPQYLNDVGRQYGVDDNGNLYQLGQTNGQIIAQVNKGSQTISPTMLIIGAVLLVVLLGSK